MKNRAKHRSSLSGQKTGRGNLEQGVIVRPFTLRVLFENIVCYSHSFEHNWGIKGKLVQYLNESCCVASDKYFSFNCFSKKSFIRQRAWLAAMLGLHLNELMICLSECKGARALSLPSNGLYDLSSLPQFSASSSWFLHKPFQVIVTAAQTVFLSRFGG